MEVQAERAASAPRASEPANRSLRFKIKGLYIRMVAQTGSRSGHTVLPRIPLSRAQRKSEKAGLFQNCSSRKKLRKNNEFPHHQTRACDRLLLPFCPGSVYRALQSASACSCTVATSSRSISSASASSRVQLSSAASGRVLKVNRCRIGVMRADALRKSPLMASRSRQS